MAAAGESARGATLVVTLEPCTHQGKQPPCTEAILRAGVRRVVAALADPNPAAAGGAQMLASHSVSVELGLLGEEAAGQNAIFLHRLSNPTRPFVALKLATSVDARIADPAGRSRWISGPEAQDFVHWLRAGFDAIGIGGYTARTDDASLTVRGPLQPAQPPRRVVFDRQADLPGSLTLVRTARATPTVLVAGPAAPTIRVRTLEEAGVTVHRAATLTQGLELLRAAGIASLLIEGGGRLAGGLLAEDLVDRFYWIQSALWLGDAGIPAFSGVPDRGLVELERWRVRERRALGEDTLLVMDRRECLPGS